MKEPVFDSEKFKAVWNRVSGQSPSGKSPPVPVLKKRKSMAVRFIPKV